jgi:hypothetical protein
MARWRGAVVAPIALLLVPPLSGQVPPVPGRGVVGGVVTDSSLGPIALVRVSLASDSSRTHTSDSAGAFWIAGVPAGRHRLVFRRLGFVPAEFDVLVTAADTLRVRVILNPIATALPAIEVAESLLSPSLMQRGYYDRRRQREQGILSGVFIDPEEIERRRPSALTDILQGLPGVTISRTASGGRVLLGNRVSIDGRARTLVRCQFAVFIDGYELDPAQVDGRRTSQSIDGFVNARDIRAIEVYTSPSGTPERFQSTRINHPCGSVVIWTKVD